MYPRFVILIPHIWDIKPEKYDKRTSFVLELVSLRDENKFEPHPQNQKGFLSKFLVD